MRLYDDGDLPWKGGFQMCKKVKSRLLYIGLIPVLWYVIARSVVRMVRTPWTTETRMLE